MVGDLYSNLIAASVMDTLSQSNFNVLKKIIGNRQAALSITGHCKGRLLVSGGYLSQLNFPLTAVSLIRVTSQAD